MADKPNPAGVESWPCCPETDWESRKECDVCGKPRCRNCTKTVAARELCSGCARKVAPPQEAFPDPMPPWSGALVYGLSAAVFSAIVWAAISIFMGIQMGYVAMGIGWLAGSGVVRGSGGQRGVPWMIAGASCGLFGFVLGWYIIAASITIEALGLSAGPASYFSFDVLRFVAGHIREISIPMDALWLVLAAGTGGLVPRDKS